VPTETETIKHSTRVTALQQRMTLGEGLDDRRTPKKWLRYVGRSLNIEIGIGTGECYV